MSLRGIGPRIAMLIPALITAALFAAYPKQVVDDAYITFRYADNFAKWGQLTWNVGEDPIQGYTSFLYTLLFVPPAFFGWSLPAAANVLGGASLLGCVALLVILLRKLRIRAWIAGAAIALFVFSPFSYSNAISGLETMFFSFSMLLVLWSAIRLSESQTALTELCFIGANAVFIFVRPEAIILTAAMLAYFILLKLPKKRLSRILLLSTLLLVLPVAAYYAWAYTYYGSTFPNTFYAKAAESLFLDYRHLEIFLQRLIAIPTVLTIGALLTGLKTSFTRQEIQARLNIFNPTSVTFFPILGVYVVFIVFICGYYAVKSHLIMDFSYRFFYPFFPIILLILATVADTFAPKKGEKGQSLIQASWARKAAWAGLAVLAILQLGYFAHTSRNEISWIKAERDIVSQARAPIAEYLNQVAPPESWIIAYIDAGYVPYFTGLKTIDFGKLNDERLAQSKLTDQQATDYFYSKNPAALIFSSSDKNTLKTGWTLYHGGRPLIDSIATDPRWSNYKLRETFWTESKPNYYYFVYLREDLISASFNSANKLH